MDNNTRLKNIYNSIKNLPEEVYIDMDKPLDHPNNKHTQDDWERSHGCEWDELDED